MCHQHLTYVGLDMCPCMLGSALPAGLHPEGFSGILGLKNVLVPGPVLPGAFIHLQDWVML